MIIDSFKKFFRKITSKDYLKEDHVTPPEPAMELEPMPELIEEPVMEVESASESEPEEEIVYGTYGRLEIPDLNISVPLYGVESGSAQQVVDLEDSAAYLKWPEQITIVDHCQQGNFANLNKAIPGQTKAFIVEPDLKKTYVCYQTQIGHIKIGTTSNVLFDKDWIPVYKSNAGGLTMYTCIEKSSQNVMDVRVTYWKPI